MLPQQVHHLEYSRFWITRSLHLSRSADSESLWKDKYNHSLDCPKGHVVICTLTRPTLSLLSLMAFCVCLCQVTILFQIFPTYLLEFVLLNWPFLTACCSPALLTFAVFLLAWGLPHSPFPGSLFCWVTNFSVFFVRP